MSQNHFFFSYSIAILLVYLSIQLDYNTTDGAFEKRPNENITDDIFVLSESVFFSKMNSIHNRLLFDKHAKSFPKI